MKLRCFSIWHWKICNKNACSISICFALASVSAANRNLYFIFHFEIRKYLTKKKDPATSHMPIPFFAAYSAKDICSASLLGIHAPENLVFPPTKTQWETTMLSNQSKLLLRTKHTLPTKLFLCCCHCIIHVLFVYGVSSD